MWVGGERERIIRRILPCRTVFQGQWRETLWPEYSIWGGLGAWQEQPRSGCLCCCHTGSQVTMAHPLCIHNPGGASLPHSMGLGSSSIEKDSWFAEEKRALSGAVMSSPQGSQWIVGAKHNRANCFSLHSTELFSWLAGPQRRHKDTPSWA